MSTETGQQTWNDWTAQSWTAQSHLSMLHDRNRKWISSRASARQTQYGGYDVVDASRCENTSQTFQPGHEKKNGSEADTKLSLNSARWRSLRRSRSFKVTFITYATSYCWIIYFRLYLAPFSNYYADFFLCTMVLITPTQKGMVRLSWPGWLVTYRDKCPAPGIEPGHSHPSQY